MIDLLSPVGDFDCLKAAVQNGANSVYFGANLFSARAFASNFDLDELKNAIQYARIRGVKTNLTLNTLIKNDEFEDAFVGKNTPLRNTNMYLLENGDFFVTPTNNFDFYAKSKGSLFRFRSEIKEIDVDGNKQDIIGYVIKTGYYL